MILHDIRVSANAHSPPPKEKHWEIKDHKQFYGLTERKTGSRSGLSES